MTERARTFDFRFRDHLFISGRFGFGRRITGLQYYAELQIRISIKDMTDRPAYFKSDHVILEPNSDYVAFFSSYDNNLKYEH